MKNSQRKKDGKALSILPSGDTKLGSIKGYRLERSSTTLTDNHADIKLK